MRARELLDGSGAGFSSATLKAMHQALESAWASIATQFTDAQAIEAARLKLAECVLGATRDGMTDAFQIERLALSLVRISN